MEKTKNEKTKVPSKIEQVVSSIQSDLKDIEAGKILGITKTLGLIAKFTNLNALNGLQTSTFFSHKLLKVNSFKNIDWKNDKVNNTERLKLFCDYSLVGSLNATVESIKENEPFKYETLREIAMPTLSAITFQYLYYKTVTEKTGKETKTCFTQPLGNKPAQILIKSSAINQDISLKAKFNAKDDYIVCVPLSFEKLKTFSEIKLFGMESRLTKTVDPTESPVSKKIDKLTDELGSNVQILGVDFNKKDKDGKIDTAGIELEKKQRELQVDKLLQLIISQIAKLIDSSDFDAVRKIVIHIATVEKFIKNQNEHFATAIGFISDFGGRKMLVDLSDIKINVSTDKLIDSRLKRKAS
tara:strand:+ start:312 stop:1376 length:1065 start_codon:yes stop_codon:yes gene_type:complete